MKAQALAFTGRHADALLIAGSLLKSTPSYELLLDDYSSYAIDLRDFQAALEPAKRAVALNPWSAAYRERLAFVSMQCQDWNGAVHEARERFASIRSSGSRACFWCNASCTTTTRRRPTTSSPPWSSCTQTSVNRSNSGSPTSAVASLMELIRAVS